MNSSLRRFAGPVLSLLGILIFVGTLVVSGLSNAGLFTPPDPQIITRVMWISLAVVVLGLAVAALLNPEETRKFFLGRQAQYGSNALIMLVAFVGILFFINMIVYQNPKSWDMTEDKQNTLAPETINTLQSLKEPVSARAYYTSQLSSDTVQKLLQNFKENSGGKFDYKFIDPNNDPVAAQADGVDRDGTVVFQMGSQKTTVQGPSEQDIDSALIRLMDPSQRVIYFLTGHGEHDINGTDDKGMSSVKQALQNKNYTVNVLNLRSQGSVPKDAKAIVIAGPVQPLYPEEVTVLQKYLDGGGSLVVMEDPLPLTSFGNTPDPLADLLKKWGITLDNDIIIDPNANPALYAIADPQSYGQSPITTKLQGVLTVFPDARSIQEKSPSSDITLTPLAVTAQGAWGETNFDSLKNNSVSYDQKSDVAGPVKLAVSGENSKTKARLVVFGDSQFAIDALYQRGNGDILINAIDWAANQQNLINLTPKNSITRTYNPPGSFQLISIFLISLCLIPLVIIGGGIAAWASRRKRG